MNLARPRRWMFGTALYAATAGSLAAAGGVTQHSLFYLAAFVLTLPLGLPALIGVYGGYALIVGVGGLVVSTTTATGDEPLWLRASTGTLDVALFTAAALGNVLVARRLLDRRRRAPVQQ